VQVGSIVFGTTYLGAEWRNIVSDIIVHTNFRKLNANNFLGGVGEYRNDCAMMKIEPVTNANLTPAVLNANGSIPVNGEILIVTAYGRISASGQYDASPGLRRTGQLAENTNCTFAFKSFQTSVSFCTSGPNRDLCEGTYTLCRATVCFIAVVAIASCSMTDGLLTFPRPQRAITVRHWSTPPIR